jgi:nitrite reductase/ring-hydroxylating ferredoxin subunit
MDPGRQLTCVGVYPRSLPVSAERVWENVRDWEHLPWLHSSSFSSIECLDQGAWGWRARIAAAGDVFTLELVIESDAPRYVSRTLDGGGAGTEIWTDIQERGEKETHVRVEFWLPEVPAEGASRLAEFFVALYTRLWDEDESMMLRRAEELASRSRARAFGTQPVGLGSLADVTSRLPLVVDFGAGRFRVVEHDGALVAHAVVCPHRLGPLEDVPVQAGKIVCPWHGYAFDIASGKRCDGGRMRLLEAPRVEVDPASREVRLVAR